MLIGTLKQTLENSENNEQKILHGPFKVNVHKQTFTNYLEVIIKANGRIEYAVPSHSIKLEIIYAKQRGFKRWRTEDKWQYEMRCCRYAESQCPKEHHYDYTNWLCKETKCLAVWGFPNSKYFGEPNQKQLETIEMLKKEGLF